MRMLILPQSRYRLKKLNWFARYQKIRKYSKLKNSLFFLRSNRRRWQIWRWRFNRKSYQAWKPLRYVKHSSLNGLVKLRHQTNFRLQRTIKNYLQWRFNSKYLNLIKIKQSYSTQNVLQNSNQANYAWLVNNHIGSIGMNFYQLRYMTRLYKNQIYVNSRAPNNSLVLKNSILIFTNWVKKPIPKTLAFETSGLIHGLIQYNLNNSLLLAKYHPKQQRHLNANLL